VITERPAVLDTCILINLLATGRIAEIVRIIAPTCLVCSVVSRESLYLRPLEAAGTREAVNLAPLFDAGVLAPCQIEGPAEEELYVNYAFELDDGEAMSLAIAQARNLALATDERKARRVARENAPQLLMISTAQITWAWVQERDEGDTVTVVRSILTRARFRPSASDPLAPWWDELLER
jgi:predicted nucleic acid-binding protein